MSPASPPGYGDLPNTSTHEVPIDANSAREKELLSKTNNSQYLTRLYIKMEVKMGMTNSAISETFEEITEILTQNKTLEINALKCILLNKGLKDEEADGILFMCKQSETPLENLLKPGGALSTNFRRNHVSSSKP